MLQVQQLESDSLSVLCLLHETFPRRKGKIPVQDVNLDSSSGGQRRTMDFPKAHAAVAHIPEAILLFGRILNCSAGPTENKHLDVKVDASLTNQRTDWLLQILLRQKRIDDVGGLSEEHGLFENTGVLERKNGVASAREKRKALASVFAQHCQCSKTLKSRATYENERDEMTLNILAFASSDCFWSLQDASGHLQHLPKTLASHIQVLCHKHITEIPAPQIGQQLDISIWHGFLKMVLRPWRTAMTVSTGNLAVYNQLTIQSPDVDTEVRRYLYCMVIWTNATFVRLTRN